MAQRRKTIVRNTPENTKPEQRCTCFRCGQTFSKYEKHFPKSHSPLFREVGYVPFCFDCVENMFKKYVEETGSERSATKRMCMKLDLYWNDDLFNMVEKQERVNSTIRSYMSKTNMARYISKDYDDTLREEAALEFSRRRDRAAELGIIDEDDEIMNDKEFVVPQEIVSFWGPGFDREFYLDLDRRYKQWTEGIDDSAPNVRGLYKQICLLEARINKDIASGQKVSDNTNALNSLLGSLNLKPTQQKDEQDSSLDKIPFGVGIGWCEKRRPIPEPDPAFKDVDGIIKYITVWFYGHIAKMLNKKDLRSRVYEEEIQKMRVTRPEYEDEDDETFLNDVLLSEKEDDDE